MQNRSPRSWELVSSLAKDNAFPATTMVNRLRADDEAIFRSGSSVQIVGFFGSGKTSVLLSYLSEARLRPDFRMLRGFEIPQNQYILESWFSENDACRILVIEEATEAPEADVAVFVQAARRRSIRVLVTTTRKLHLPGLVDIVLGDLTTDEAERILEMNNALSNDLKLPSSVVKDLASMATRFRTPRVLITVALECMRHPTMSAREVLASLDGELYQLSLASIELPKAIDIIVCSNEQIIKQLRDSPQGLFQLTPRRFEEIVTEILKEQGCEVHLTPSSGDGGLDIYASYPTPFGRMLCLVEVKRYRSDRPVGVELVRNLYGTLCAKEANSAMLVTTSRFTKGAEDFQRERQQVLHLRDYLDLTKWLYSYGNRLIAR